MSKFYAKLKPTKVLFMTADADGLWDLLYVGVMMVGGNDSLM